MTPAEHAANPAASLLRHNASSRAMILDTWRRLGRPDVLVLGCGRCSDIPAVEMLNSCRVDFVEVDGKALADLQHDLANLGAKLRHATFCQCDLTGLIATARATAESCIVRSLNSEQTTDVCTRFLDDAECIFPAWPQKYDVVVCSLLLTQLQSGVTGAMERILTPRVALGASWARARLRFARRLEDAFIRHLRTLVQSDGAIYLSDTVRLSFVRSDGIADGAWTATRTDRLSDYLIPDWRIAEERIWPWFLPKRESGSKGRLYEVQALIAEAPAGRSRCFSD